MITKISVSVLLATLFCFPIYVDAGDNLQGRPFKNLQKQIDELTRQLGDLNNRFTPPTISFEFSCDTSSLTIDLDVEDGDGITYYAIQEQGGDPPINIIIFVEPELTNVNYAFTVDPGPGNRRLLFIASDIYGNASNTLFDIDPDICLDQ
jgi:hypothetical protein